MALNPDTTNMEHDPQLAADYKAASAEMPSSYMDDRIRAAARREVGAGPRRQSRWSAWQVPLSLAAVVVLSVTIVLMMHDEGVDRAEPELPPLAEAVAPQVATEPAAKQRMAEAPRPSPVPQGAAPAVTGVLQANPAPAAVDAAPPIMAKASPAAEPPAPAAAAVLRDEARVAESNVAPAREAARPLLRSAPVGATADNTAGPAARSAAPMAAMSAPAPGRVLWQDLVNEPAEKWVQRIVEWRRAGRAADADLLVAEFRRRFPDQTLPDDAAAR